MTQSKHIFIQVDTEKVAAFYNAKGTVSREDALRSSLIFEQGSMAMGDPIKNFHIEIEKGENIHFTVLPYFLFSRNKLYFSGIHNKEHVSLDLVPKDISSKVPQPSFLLETNNLSNDESIHFSLNILMDFILESGKSEIIDFIIDPVLKIKQR